jgi:creatinine amidohydrolase
MAGVRYTDLTYLELRELAPSVGAVLIPLGCTEQQGPHLPVDFDAWMIEHLCLDIAAWLKNEQGLTVLTMPTLPFGPTPEHVGFQYGYVNLRQSTHEAVVEDILESLAAQGFERLLVWRGCGGHDLSRVVDEFNATHEVAFACQPVINYGGICLAAFGGPVPGGHADSFATSIRLHLDSERVRTADIRRPRPEAITIDWSDPLDFSAFSDTGVIGDPTRASKEAGAKIWQLCVEEGARIVLDVVGGKKDIEQRFGWWSSP